MLTRSGIILREMKSYGISNSLRLTIGNSEENINGSIEAIAGITNKKKNILGMMPHPERMVDEIISNKDGVNLFSSLMN